MQNKTRGLNRNLVILISAFVPNFLTTANGTLFNRQNEVARDALDPFLHGLVICGLLIVVSIGIMQYRKSEW